MKVKVSESLDDLATLVDNLKATSKEIGGIAVFVGVVRSSRLEEKVLRMEYESHETLAPKVIEQIIEETKAKHKIMDAVVEHRVGTVQVGEDVMYVLVASKHREEAFQALKETVDRVKHEAPIWKKEITRKGAYWVQGSETTSKERSDPE